MSKSHENFATVNFEEFVAQYMDMNTEPFVFQQSAIQLYPLSIASSLIKPPTPLFRAEYNFLLLFRDGGGKQKVDNEIIELRPNDVLFIREGHLNAVKYIDPRTDGYYIYMDSTLLPRIFTHNTLLHRFTFYPKHSVSTSVMDWLCQGCEMIAQQKTANLYSQEIQYALLKAVVLKLAEASAHTLSTLDRQSEITMQFKKLVYNNFIQNRDVKFYADALAVSENYLNRCVNQITRKPPKQHINEWVIAHSKVLLQDRAKGIAQIAFARDSIYF